MNHHHPVRVPGPGSTTTEDTSFVEASPHEVADDLRREVRRLSTYRASLVARLGTMPKGTTDYKDLLGESARLAVQIEDIHTTLREIGSLGPRKNTLKGIPTPAPPKDKK